MIAGFPYHLFIRAKESTYHAIFLALLKGMAINVQAEFTTNVGRADLIMKTDHITYVVECKLDSKADLALEQIKAKKYFEPFTCGDQSIVLLGINFSTKTRNITEWKFPNLRSSFPKDFIIHFAIK